MAQTKAPSGLKVSRNGNKLTVEWKIADTDYGAGQQLEYTIEKWNGTSGEASLSDVIKLSAGATKYNFVLDPTKYFPAKGMWIDKITFEIRGRRKPFQETYTEGKGKNKKTKHRTITPSWSKWSDITFETDEPFTPTGSVSLTSQSNVVRYSWTTKEATKTRLQSDVAMQTLIKADCPKDYKSLTGWSNVSSRSLNGYYEPTEDTSVIGTGSHTRVVRVRARGMSGRSGWKYMLHTFATPYAAKNVTATATKDTKKNTFACTAEWTASNTFQHPVDNTKVEYAIATPEANMACPDEASWIVGDQIADTKDKDKTSFNIDSLIGLDKCLFIRVVTEHAKTTNENYFANSIPVIAKKDGTGYLKSPTIDNVTTDAVNHAATIEATNTSDVEDSVLIVSYKNAVDQKAVDVGVITRAQTQTTVKVEDWTGKEPIQFGVRAVVGKVTTKTVGGISKVTVSDVIMKSQGTVWQAGTVPKAPENVSLDQTLTNDILVTWDWAWNDADSAEISWADRENAWESTEEPDTFVVSKLRQSRLNISGLETGKRWYVRVRLIKGTEDNAVYGGYSDTQWIDLNATPIVPALVLSKESVTEDGSFIANWSYVSNDDTPQKQASLCEVTYANNQPVYTEIGKTDTEQQIQLYAKDLIEKKGWTVNSEHALAVLVLSGSDKWSDPSNIVYITVAEPLLCEITQTNLEVAADEDVNKGHLMITLPLEVEVNATGTETSVAIERTDSYRNIRPDGRDLVGHVGETIAVKNVPPYTFDKDELTGSLDDGADYRIYVVTKDDLGQENDDELEFTVRWEHQAAMPAGVVQIEGTIAKLNPIAPADTEEWQLGEGDYCDIYRLSADLPQLIYSHASFYDENDPDETTYIDPYPTIGEKGGYRFVFYTANGDYIIENDNGDSAYAWYDVATDFEYDRTLIDFGGDQVQLKNNVDVSHSWTKEFQSVKYLGGTEVGAWNEGVSRSGSVSAVALTFYEQDVVNAMRRLSQYVGPCHIRTQDGSSFTADVQVSEDDPHDKRGMVTSFSMSVSKIDPVILDGLKLSDYEPEEEEEEDELE